MYRFVTLLEKSVNRDHVWDTVTKQDSNYRGAGGGRYTDS